MADAAANSLLQVPRPATSTCWPVSPRSPRRPRLGCLGPAPVTVKAQAVPTSDRGRTRRGVLRRAAPRRALGPGTAYIYRVVPGHQPEIWARGLTAVTAIAFDGHGRLLATEYSTGGLLSPPTIPGALVRISHHGHTVTTLPVTGLFQPTGVAVGSNGAVYVSNYGDSIATAAHPGEILEITGLH